MCYCTIGAVVIVALMIFGVYALVRSITQPEDEDY